MENKESVLEQIKENYFYIYNKNKVNELIGEWNDKRSYVYRQNTEIRFRKYE
ncbi:hypothetical protein [Lactobacillus taiwanensis]|uniref:hypothetical protein n=1 Tax=Lactobacillus taiwanensis TaxID=508451 RepID=UPI00129D79A3|nr:hypothetical protein [Lactobacillus taiwanensis]